MSHIDTIVIEAGLIETRSALLADGEVRDILIDRSRRRSQVGDIHLGRIARVMPGLKAAFVDIGGPGPGFLPFRELGEGGAEALRQGQRRLVQVIADPVEDKGPRLTANPSLPGHYLVLQPARPGIRLSRRIDEAAERERLEAAVAPLLGGDGAIIRTQAIGADADLLAGELDALRDDWRSIETAARRAKGPELLHSEPEPLIRVLRDHLTPNTRRVEVFPPAAARAATAYCQDRLPGFTDRIHGDAKDGLFDRLGVEAELQAALNPHVAVPEGGSIVIEATTAMTVIDVNSGAGGGDTPERSALAANMAAVPTIARQLRLRRIGGIIVIDFIDLKVKGAIAKLLDGLRRALAADPVPARVVGMSELGLVEMTRRRDREALAELMLAPCDTCGRGLHAHPEAVAAEAERCLLGTLAEGAKGRGIEIAVAAPVAEILLARTADGGAGFAAQWERQWAVPVAVTVVAGAAPDHIDIQLRTGT